MKTIKKGSTAYFLLLTLQKSLEAGFSLSDFLANPGKFVWTGYRTDPKSSTLYKSINQLLKKGYIEKHKKGRKILFKLTKQGNDKAILLKILNDTVWDGFWRIVIFDIPEKKRRIRYALRAKLREWQFEQLQKSVWVSKKDVVNELKSFIKEIGIKDWVKVFEAKAK